MGRISVKKDKSVFQLKREELRLSREEASELTGISAERIEKIENEKVLINPDDVRDFAKGYKAPFLCNYYCSHECAIGKECVPEVRPKELSQIVLEILSSLNEIQQKKDRLVSITVDGKIDSSEIDDFLSIKAELDGISSTVDSLRLWLKDMAAEGKIDERVL